MFVVFVFFELFKGLIGSLDDITSVHENYSSSQHKPHCSKLLEDYSPIKQWEIENAWNVALVVANADVINRSS